MIRVNLIPSERRPSKAAARTFNLGEKATLLGSMIFVVTGLLVGWRYWTLDQYASRLVTDIESARAEEVRLAEVLKQVTEFEARRAQLQERVALIDDLRKGQSAPVHIVDQISRSLPEMMWLTSLKQEGYDVTIEGRSTTLSALSDFVSNLEATRYFKRPVEIVQSEVAPGTNDLPDLIEFTIKGSFQMAGLDAGAATKATTRGGARPAAKGGKVG
jgi:type IV pilus assembly protein PilN